MSDPLFGVDFDASKIIEVNPGASISSPTIASIIFFCFFFPVVDESRIEFWENKNDDKKRIDIICLIIIEINTRYLL